MFKELVFDIIKVMATSGIYYIYQWLGQKKKISQLEQDLDVYKKLAMDRKLKNNDRSKEIF